MRHSLAYFVAGFVVGQIVALIAVAFCRAARDERAATGTVRHLWERAEAPRDGDANLYEFGD